MFKSKHVRTGIKGEKFIKHLLEAEGYTVEYTDGDFSGDWKVKCPQTGRTINLEVKTANKGQDGSFKFCLYREGKTDCKHSDVVALVFIDKKEIFVRFVDVFSICGVKTLNFRSLPHLYTGKYKSAMKRTIDALQAF